MVRKRWCVYFCLFSIFALLYFSTASASEVKTVTTQEQTEITLNNTDDTHRAVKEELNKFIVEQNNAAVTNDDNFQDDKNIQILPSIMWGVPSNEKVNYFLNYFKTRVRERFKIWLSRSSKYLPIFSRIFQEHGIAEELIFLPLIESGFSPYATSRAQAVGIWQFMRGTAIKYGLRVDKFVDERKDPEKSAKAAALYLKDLYNMFGSWDFALAAYNAGEGKIMRTMSSVGSKDFWDVIAHRKIKKETKEYVPRFVAATLIAKEPEQYGFEDIVYETGIEYEEVMLPPKTTLKSVAKLAEIDEALVKNLNPSIKHGFLPPDTYYPVKVPKGKKEILLSNINKLQYVDSKTLKKIMAMKDRRSYSKKYKAKKHKKVANAKRIGSLRRS